MHACDNPLCVNPAHLVGGTQKDNARDCEAKGRRSAPKGEGHRSSKLTEAQVLAIRDDGRHQWQIALDYGVGQTHVGKIKRRESWAHLAERGE